MWVAAYRAKFHGEGKPFGKAEWDQLLGHCMVITCPSRTGELYKNLEI